MQFIDIRAVAIATLALAGMGFVACDVEQPDDELARELDEAEDPEEAAGARPGAADELTAPLDPMGANYYVPVGTHDEANCDVIEGWVRDGDTNLPSWVTVYRDGAFPSGTHIKTEYANLYRSDLPFADKNHGFSFATPASLKDGNWHSVYVHGINIDTSGNWGPPGVTNPLLFQTPFWVCCGQGCDDPPDDDGGSNFVQDPTY